MNTEQFENVSKEFNKRVDLLNSKAKGYSSADLANLWADLSYEETHKAIVKNQEEFDKSIREKNDDIT